MKEKTLFGLMFTGEILTAIFTSIGLFGTIEGYTHDWDLNKALDLFLNSKDHDTERLLFSGFLINGLLFAGSRADKLSRTRT